jgi:hypothetical protein
MEKHRGGRLMNPGGGQTNPIFWQAQTENPLAEFPP